VKDYEGPDQEVEQAVQMCLAEVVSEDSRFMEREAPPLSEEFPEGTKVFFLGEHAYGVAAQVNSITDETLSVILAVRFSPFFLHRHICSLPTVSSTHRRRPKLNNSKPSLTTADQACTIHHIRPRN